MAITAKKKLYGWILLGILILSLFFLLQSIVRRQTTINQAANKRSGQVKHNPYKERTTFDRYTEHAAMRQKFGDAPRLPDDKIQNIIDQSKAEQGEIGDEPPVLKRVMLLIYDPIMITHAGQRLRDLYGWKDPEEITERYINDIRQASHGYLQYQIAETQVVDAFPEKIDGFVYDEQSYLDCAPLPGTNPPGIPNALCHQPDESDYYQILKEHDVCEKTNRGEIDELWLFGGPFFGFYEAAMAGPFAHDTNGGIFREGTDCIKNLYIMGFNYQYNEVNMLHDFIHRTEGSMRYLYGDWKNRPYSAIYNNDNLTPTVTTFITPTTAPPPYTHWDDYAATALFPSIVPGIGTAHWPPNVKTYAPEGDFDNITPVQSSADDWTRYPNILGTTTAVSSINWDQSEHGFFLWFLSHLPHVAGKNTDNTFNNWWKYLVDMNSHYPDPPCDSPTIRALSPQNDTFTPGEPSSVGRLVPLNVQFELHSCLGKSRTTIVVRDVTEQEDFRELCYDEDPAAQSLECTVPIVPNHDYEWKVQLNNFSRYVQSPVQRFTTSPPPCDTPHINLWSPPQNTVFSSSAERIGLQADVQFRTCSGHRERSIYVRDASIGEDFQSLCFYTEDTEDLRFECSIEATNNHWYEWYATASNGTHTVQTPTWRFAVGAFPTNTPTPTHTPTPTRTPTPTPIDCERENISACTCARADTNTDCKVDVFDLVKAGACYDLPSTQNSCQVADVISDGHVRTNDLCCISACYGQACPFE